MVAEHLATMLALMRNFNHYTLYTPYLEVLPIYLALVQC